MMRLHKVYCALRGAAGTADAREKPILHLMASNLHGLLVT